MNIDSSTFLKKLNTISLTDNDGNSYVFTRTEKRWFNIAKREVLTDGKVPDRDGLVPDAVFFTNEQVAELVAQSEVRGERLYNIESLLEQWIGARRPSKSRRRAKSKSKSKSKQDKVTLQKQEVIG